VIAVLFDLFGTLVTAPTSDERAHAASRLADVVGCDIAAVEPVADELRSLGQARLAPEPPVIHTLESLRSKAFRLGVLSDAGQFADLPTALEGRLTRSVRQVLAVHTS
jgi:putative hydrolase of the HAD superfamily